MSLEQLGWLLLVETGLLGLLALFLVFFVLGKKKKQQRQAVNSVTKSFKANSSKRSKELNGDEVFLSLDDELLEAFLSDIKKKEATLYRQINQVFLQKDAAVLKLLDKSVTEISDTYWGAIRKSLLRSQDSSDALQDIETLKLDLKEAASEQERLAEQLKETLSTLDEVSNEYAHLFNSNKDQDELTASKERMLACFQ